MAEVNAGDFMSFIEEQHDLFMKTSKLIEQNAHNYHRSTCGGTSCLGEFMRIFGLGFALAASSYKDDMKPEFNPRMN